MDAKVIEGTWEEVCRRSSELAGHRVRVEVLKDQPSSEDSHDSRPGEGDGPTVLDVLSRAGLIGCLKGGPTDLASSPDHMEGLGGE